MTTPPSSSFAPRLLAGLSAAAFVAGVGLFAASRPAHSTGGPVPVAVTNAVQDRDSPARQPFQQQALLSFSGGFLSPSYNFGTVPAGKRLVIESLTANDTSFSSDTNSFDVLLSCSTGLLGMSLTPGPDSFPIKTQTGRLTVEAGDSLLLNIAGNRVVSASRVLVSVSGYYVDVP